MYQKTVALEPGRYKLDLVVKDLESGDVVIEYGPGTGSLTQQVALLQADGVDRLTPGLLADLADGAVVTPGVPDVEVEGDADPGAGPAGAGIALALLGCV